MMEMCGTPASSSSFSACCALGMLRCIEGVPSCIRAPPPMATETSGVPVSRARCAAKRNFSPISSHRLLPTRPKLLIATTAACPPMAALPVIRPEWSFVLLMPRARAASY